jgi:hypothetical protein
MARDRLVAVRDGRECKRELLIAPSSQRRLGPNPSRFLNKRADWIPAFAGLTKLGGFEKLRKENTSIGAGFQAFLPRNPRQMAIFDQSFCSAHNRT